MVAEGLTALSEASRRYGADSVYVFGGGGNTSFKTDEHLYVKPSGVELATIEPEQFVKMDRRKIQSLFDMKTPNEPADREALVKQAMASAVCPDSAGRPSVEAPLHELLPQAYVIHMHSIWINGMTCAVDGPDVCAKLFPDALWVEYVDPGYTLAVVIRERLNAFIEKTGSAPSVIFLQSHGAFVAGDSVDAVDALYNDIHSKLQAEYKAAGVTPDVESQPLDIATAREVAPLLRTLLGTDNARAVVQCADAIEPVEDALTPDHIVYAKSYPFIGTPTAETLDKFQAGHGYAPRVVTIPGKATFAVESSLKSARLVLEAAQNARQIVNLTQAFGGTRWMTAREREFIENWEVESYRKKVSESGSTKPMSGKVVVVTGGAQGFGYGIAEELAGKGAVVGIVDLNADGAAKAAADIDARFGKGSAFAVTANVGDEESVAGMAEAIVRETGGLDVFIANAGVLRAGSVKSLSKRDWDLVNTVNYTGYFLCVKHVSPIMAAQNVGGKGKWMDIIQISSKSGLEGSNKNGAYAGSKFGGIGLTQSFALELVEDRIKVNSICPGNFFDGPLWADPDNGLFVQYLNSGKVPGATSIAEVKAFYEAKVPMGRGCNPEDVARAIMYVVDQQYETGQALPVTGGQVMLR